MTEKQARTKWCPFNAMYTTLTVQKMGLTDFIKEEAQKSVLCCASDCMMWRAYGIGRMAEGGWCGLGGKE